MRLAELKSKLGIENLNFYPTTTDGSDALVAFVGEGDDRIGFMTSKTFDATKAKDAKNVYVYAHKTYDNWFVISTNTPKAATLTL